MAIEGPEDGLQYTKCSVTDVNHPTAWWGVKLPELAYVTNIKIYNYVYGKYQYMLIYDYCSLIEIYEINHCWSCTIRVQFSCMFSGIFGAFSVNKTQHKERLVILDI